MSLIDNLLYRPLKEGKEYEGLIPAYLGTRYNFDKETDNSNTYDTLKFMSEWANKYTGQMSKVAAKLKGKSLQETVNNVYQFLYSHFQYRLDGQTQNLYSPSAAWRFRKQGFDCKTFSILGSEILQNLNIPHAFRMVQQAGIMPGEWSHVYVIVPNGNSHYIIDATTHNNKEVSFTNKYDYKMQHQGLASPYVTGLGCACQGNPITAKGLGAPSVLANTVSNFHDFLNELERMGFSKKVTDRMLQLVKWNVENGIDPNMGEIVKKALSPEGSLGFTNPFTSSLHPSGTNSYAVPLPTANMPTNIYQPQTGYQTFGSGIKTGAVSAGTSLVGNMSIAGVSGSTIMAAAMGDPMAMAQGAIQLLTKIIPIEKTFGAVFANGFDLSCWGASYSEQKAKEHILLDLPFMKDWSGIYSETTNANLDRFQIITESYLQDAISGQQRKYASCTRKGHALRQKGVEQLRKDLYEEFTSEGYQLVPSIKKTGNINIPSGMPGYGKGIAWVRSNVSYDTFTIIAPSPVVTEQVASVDADGNPITPSAKKSSISPVAIGGALLLAAKLLL